ncbi:MAG: GNAT family N-acetyltransferase [Pyrinomonadaceae bacterium]
MSPYIYINSGDTIKLKKLNEQVISVEKEVTNGGGEYQYIKLFPLYEKCETVVLSPHVLNIKFRERQTPNDLKAIRLLEQFHYRGKGLNRLVGRRTVLLAEADGIGVIGYGVISATVLAARPRFELFEVSLAELMRSKLINQIVRIPRVVVHPEFRGLGLGSRLAKHLVLYASEHWDIKGYQPIMVEVIASMTQYHKFFEMAGFICYGFTEGKATVFKPIYGSKGWEDRPNVDNYKFSSPLGPKPYLIYPLNNKVKRLIANKRPMNIEPPNILNTTPLLTEPIKFKNVSVSYITHSRRTLRAAEVKKVFGVDGTQMSSPVLNKFTLSIQPGDVVLTTGASGSGKSTLLKLLTLSDSRLSGITKISGIVHRPSQKEIGVLSSDWSSRLPLVNQIGGSLEESIAILNSVGLAEAHLYLKTPKQISEGQRYRFSIARLCYARKPVWIADEFASTLDPYTAAVVAKGLRKQAARAGATLIVAAPHINNFVSSLAPTQLIILKWGGQARINAMKLLAERTTQGVKFTVINRARTQLTNLRATLTDSDGQEQELISIAHLSGLERSAEFELSIGNIKAGNIVRITSTEGVGDVVYFGIP